jgi:hypothetical protein
MPVIVTRGGASIKALGFAGAGKPLAPTIGTNTRASNVINVVFTPGYNGGAPVMYTATSTPGNYIFTGSDSPIAATGMTLGTAYTFTVYATNVYGSSPSSAASNSLIYASVPLTPTVGTATIVSPTSVTVTYTAPSGNGGEPITSYTAISTPGNITGTASRSGSGTITVSGLVSGTAYTFNVYATNVLGDGPQSVASNSVTPDLPTYTITSSVPSPVNEGTAISFYVDTNETVAATTIYWGITGTGITAGDLGLGSLTGSLAITASSRATLALNISNDGITEGNETFVLTYYSNSGRTTVLSGAVISGYVTGNSRSVTVSDTSITTYAITRGAASVNEGGSISFTATISGSQSATLYWDIQSMSGTVNSSDLVVTNGSISVASGSGSYSISVTADQVTEGSEAFRVRLYSDSGRTNLLAVSANVTINDTSQYPAAGTYLRQFCSNPYDLYYVYADGSGGEYAQLVQSNSPSCGYVAPTIGADATVYFPYVINGPNTDTKAYYVYISKGNPGPAVQYWSLSGNYPTINTLGAGSGASSGTFSGGISAAVVVFRAPTQGNYYFYVNVSGDGYTSFQKLMLVADNPYYSPYTYANGFSQEFGRTGSALNLASGIGEGIYRSNFAWTVDYNDGLGPRTRWSFYRAPDAGGVNYWVGICIQNGWNWDTPAFVNTIIQAGELGGARVTTPDKPYIAYTGYGDFGDRP